MKHTALIFFISFLLFSCSTSENTSTQNSDQNTSPDSLGINQTSTTNEELNIDQVVNQLKPISLPQNWNVEYLDSPHSFQSVPVTLDNFKKLNLLEEIYCDSVQFLWSHTTADWIMVCVETSSMNAKGMSFEYTLVTLGEGLIKKDKLTWAGSYSISTENPHGGTSAGVEYRTGKIDITGTNVSTTYNGKTETYSIDYDGKFTVKKTPIELDKPYYTEATLTDIYNVGGTMAFAFDEDGKDLTFYNMVVELTTEGNPYFYFGDPGDAAIAPVVVKDGMKKRYKVRYEYQYFEGESAEQDTHKVLTGLAKPGTEMQPYRHATAGHTLSYDDNGDYFLLSIKEKYTDRIYTIVVTDQNTQNQIADNWSPNSYILVWWKWKELHEAGEGTYVPMKVLEDYTEDPHYY